MATFIKMINQMISNHKTKKKNKCVKQQRLILHLFPSRPFQLWNYWLHIQCLTSAVARAEEGLIIWHSFGRNKRQTWGCGRRKQCTRGKKTNYTAERTQTQAQDSETADIPISPYARARMASLSCLLGCQLSSPLVIIQGMSVTI